MFQIKRKIQLEQIIKMKRMLENEKNLENKKTSTDTYRKIMSLHALQVLRNHRNKN